MRSYQYVVLTHPVEGREDEYNDWYTNTHIHEIMLIPGFRSAKRYRLAPRPEVNPSSLKHPYLALYEIESDDVEATLGELRRRSAAGELKTSTALDRSKTSSTLYELFAEAKAK